MKNESIFGSACQRLLCLSLLLLPAGALWAHEGHEAEPKTGAASPAAEGAPQRFSLSSANYELVGVLNGHDLTLFLDHAADNRPVQGAQLSLALGGQQLKPEPHGEAGEFELVLAARPTPGSWPVQAVVQIQGQSEVLKGSLELLPLSHAAAPLGPKPSPSFLFAAALLGSAAVALLAWLTSRRLAARKNGASA